MNRRVLVVLIVAVLAGVGYFLYERRLSHLPREWSGTVDAHTMEVGSRVGGRIQAVDAREGDMVKAGQVLIVLEPGDLPAQKLQAEGQLEQAEAALDKVASKTLPTPRRAEIAASQARLHAEEINVEKTKLDHERMEKLFGAGAATRADKDNADLAFRNSTANVAALQATLDQLLQGTPQDVKSAHGQVDAAQGKLDQINVMIDELNIKSPLAARVESLDLRPGDILAPNATAAKLLEPGQLFVRIYVPETQLGFIHQGMKVPIYVDSFENRSFQGTVEFVSDVGEFTPRNLQTVDERADQVFATRVRIDEGADVLRAGMAATVRVPK